MALARIYLLRHGEIDTTYRGRFVGQVDLSLSESGKLQARLWERELSETELNIIYCSDLERSKVTASIIAGARKQNVEIIPELREINLGDWEGMEIEQVKRVFAEQWRMRGMEIGNYRPPNGESFSDLASRVLPVFQSMVDNLKGNILIVGHSGVNRVILCHALGMPLTNLFNICQDYGCMNILEFSVGCLRLKAMNILPSVRTCKLTTAVCR
ncbi:MAG: histidine phosphatase family protein [Deltaproteobacteria bacterium]|nr:histidine phosphatase family protein [Deltaproteobacteria bacterium]